MRIEVGLREMNQQFADYIHRVENGTEIIVTRRKKPIAIITPISEPSQVESATEEESSETLETLFKNLLPPENDDSKS